MRYPSLLILICVLFFNSFYAQKNNISEAQWGAIVDQTNVEVTWIYIEELFKSDKLKEKESKSYLDTLRPRFESSSFRNPISYDSLGVLMKSNFKDTFGKLSSKIVSARNKPKVLDTLYSTLQVALREVKKEEIYTSGSIQALKADINEFIETKSKEPQVMFQPSNEGKITESRDSSKFTIPNVAIGVLVLLLILILWQFVATKAKLKKLEEKAARYREVRDSERTENFENQRKKNKLEKEIQKFKEKLMEFEKVNIASTSQLKNEFEPQSETAPVISWDNPTPPPPAPTTFYGGKPTPDRKFTVVTEKIIDQETVFKFTFDGVNRNKATFEVILASEFMKKQIPNSPDDFLFRVCNNSNSNQEFRREILTERKGIAHLRDSVWVVDENDKALIKFQ